MIKLLTEKTLTTAADVEPGRAYYVGEEGEALWYAFPIIEPPERYDGEHLPVYGLVTGVPSGVLAAFVLADGQIEPGPDLTRYATEKGDDLLSMDIRQDVLLPNLKAYIEMKGWHVAPSASKWLVYVGPDGDDGHPLEIVLPSQSDAPDFPSYLTNAVNLLSVLEEEAPEVTVRRIKHYNSAVLYTHNVVPMVSAKHVDELVASDKFLPRDFAEALAFDGAVHYFEAVVRLEYPRRTRIAPLACAL